MRFFGIRIPELFVELPPFLLGPAELFDGRRQVEEVDGDDGGPRAEIRISDEGV